MQTVPRRAGIKRLQSFKIASNPALGLMLFKAVSTHPHLGKARYSLVYTDTVTIMAGPAGWGEFAWPSGPAGLTAAMSKRLPREEPTRLSRERGLQGSTGPIAAGSETPAEKLLVPYIDSRLSMRLLGSNLWLARVKRRALSKRNLGDVTLERLLMEVIRVSRGEGKPVYAVLNDGRGELRILALTDRVGIALVEPGRSETGRAALDASRGMSGLGAIYVLREVPF